MPTTDEIIEYVMNTPDNSNPAVLRDMLNGLGGGNSLMIHVNSDGILDKTWNEIKATNGNAILILQLTEDSSDSYSIQYLPLIGVFASILPEEDPTYGVAFFNAFNMNNKQYLTHSSNDYPREHTEPM